MKGDEWFGYTLKAILKHSYGWEANNSGKLHRHKGPTCSSLKHLQPRDPKISLKDFCAAQLPLRTINLIILEIYRDTTGLFHMKLNSYREKWYIYTLSEKTRLLMTKLAKIVIITFHISPLKIMWERVI